MSQESLYYCGMSWSSGHTVLVLFPSGKYVTLFVPTVKPRFVPAHNFGVSRTNVNSESMWPNLIRYLCLYLKLICELSLCFSLLTESPEVWPHLAIAPSPSGHNRNRNHFRHMPNKAGSALFIVLLSRVAWLWLRGQCRTAMAHCIYWIMPGIWGWD